MVNNSGLYMKLNKVDTRKKIVCIGGGTGTFVTLRGLTKYPFDLSAIVAMSDSGGSNKRIRDEFGLLPTSDIRQCFVALSDEDGGAGLLRKLFMYRFEKGEGISGMTFGNLFMAALTDILGTQAEAIKQTAKVLRIKGSVIPVSYTQTNLYAQYSDGTIISEEHLIDEPSHDGTLQIKNLWLQPKAKANPEALEVLQTADLIILGPGDVYTSIIPNLLVEDIAHTIQNSKAQKIYVCNLMTKWGQTYNLTAREHLTILERYIGKSINIVLVNNGNIPKKALIFYKKYRERPVVDDLSVKEYYKIIKAALVGNTMVQKNTSDILTRSLIRHDSDLLAQAINSVI